MVNLLRMDLYRMRKAKSFWVCLILAFALSLAVTPTAKLLILLSRLISDEANLFPDTAALAQILRNPFPLLNAMLAMLSACSFFYADAENGYIKNIAGQMPRKGFTILSKFLAIMPHNLVFALAGLAGNLLGTMFLQKITMDGSVMSSLGACLLKLLLLQSICAILLLVCASFQVKSLGTVLAVLMGMGLLSLVYLGIDAGLDHLLPKKNFLISDYMPDQLLNSEEPKTLDALLVSAATIVIFLPLSIRVFDKKDIK